MSEGFKNGGLGPIMEELGNKAGVTVISLQDLKNALLGDETLDEIIAGKKCSKNVGCGKSLVKEDGSPVYVFDTKEEAETYEMEWRRTGLCPSCLNKALTALDDGEVQGETDDYTDLELPPFEDDEGSTTPSA